MRDRVTLGQVGGTRGAGLLLGFAVTALIVGTVVTHERGSGLRSVPSAPAPAGSPHVSVAETTFAVVPSSAPSAPVAVSPEPSTAAARPSATASAPAVMPPVMPPVMPTVTPTGTPTETPTGAAPSAVPGRGLTISSDALSPKPGQPASTPRQEKAGGAGPTGAKASQDKGGKGTKSASDLSTRTKQKAEPGSTHRTADKTPATKTAAKTAAKTGAKTAGKITPGPAGAAGKATASVPRR